MHLENLRLVNYKNYAGLEIDLNSSINVFVGKNGSGKTNLLDAVYFLALTKSAFAATDLQCIRKGETFSMLSGRFREGDKVLEISTGIQPGTKKVFRVNGAEYDKLSDHIGRIPLVLMAPDDTDLVREGSESRRKFFDGIISQVDKVYLETLIRYNQALKNRNSMLRMFADKGKTDFLALESYDRILADAGDYIYKRRVAFAAEFQPVFQRNSRLLAGDGEMTKLAYTSQLHESEFADGLKQNRQKDLILQRTSFGIHRDDYEFHLETGEMKRFGSQGQQKSFVIALKLAQYEVLRTYKGYRPILLLDDVFDKLDDDRIERLLTRIHEDSGQMFLTDARPDRTAGLLRGIGDMPAAVFKVDNGTITGQKQSEQ